MADQHRGPISSFKLRRSSPPVSNVAIVDPDAVHAAITAIVEVQLKDERAATVDAAKALFRSAQEVQQCFYVTGGISFVLIILAPDMRTYEGLTRPCLPRMNW